MHLQHVRLGHGLQRGQRGSILGIHCGLEGIDYEKWRAPIGDFLANSCVIPSLNAMDVPYGASYFAKLGYELAGERPAAPWDRVLEGDLETCHFEYPGSTHAFRSRGAGLRALRNTGEDACTGSRWPRVSACGLHGGEEACFYKQTYYSSQDFTDSRYDPFFAPLAYPGQTVKVIAKTPLYLYRSAPGVPQFHQAFSGDSRLFK